MENKTINMINTLNIKQQQLAKGFFTVGSGPEIILIMGSCRVVNYVNYLDWYNQMNGNRFTIHSIDPFSWNWDLEDNRTDYLQVLKGLETHEGLLSMLKSVDCFVYEYYKNAAMFNCDKNAPDGIYSFGLSPKVDVCIPAWNDHFVLFTDILSFDADMKKKALQDFNVIGHLSDKTLRELKTISEHSLEKFYHVCELSSIPEFKEYFQTQYLHKRFWHTYNHNSKHFTIAVFSFINDRYLRLPVTDEFWDRISSAPDMFAAQYTKLTREDQEAFGYTWLGEELGSIKEKIM